MIRKDEAPSSTYLSGSVLRGALRLRELPLGLAAVANSVVGRDERGHRIGLRGGHGRAGFYLLRHCRRHHVRQRRRKAGRGGGSLWFGVRVLVAR